MDHTQKQSAEQQGRSQSLSRANDQPPLEVQGYDTRHYLGGGAYGEVWVAIDENTGRKVAIKFYTRRGGLDWALLSREVEKLVFLSTDRYVVQLLDVGWDADPPYYVMEYIEQGSLEDYLLHAGSLSVGEAVEIFRDVAVGLLHAHGKGILHCDLKPANVLLDQDRKIRLADFGQSRLSHEQTPALGTLFYMAPEQADLQAVPDARWDVYALGALLYCMLTGAPPHRTDQSIETIDSQPELPARLKKYRNWIETAPLAANHLRVLHVDNDLADIIQRCIAVDPEHRFPNIQSVVDALRARDARRDRKPLIILGLVGPLLFILITLLFAWRGYDQAMGNANRVLLQQVQESNGFAADFVSEAVARRIEGYFRDVEQVASEDETKAEILAITSDDEAERLLEMFVGHDATSEVTEASRQQFVDLEIRQRLQQKMESRMSRSGRPEIASWFVTSDRGIHLASAFDTPTETNPIGGDYSYRTYYHGQPDDHPAGTRRPVQQTHLSTVFQSTATGAWKVAISTPVFHQNRIIGVVALTVELGRLDTLLDNEGNPHQFSVLVDGRDGDSRGIILQHPLFSELLKKQRNLDAKFSTDLKYRVPLAQWDRSAIYTDPISHHPQGKSYRKPWIAAKRDVRLDPAEHGDESSRPAATETGLVVIVQENFKAAAAPLEQLGRSLLRQGILAISILVLVIGVLWYFVSRALGDPNEATRRRGMVHDPDTLNSMETLEIPAALRRR